MQISPQSDITEPYLELMQRAQDAIDTEEQIERFNQYLARIVQTKAKNAEMEDKVIPALREQMARRNEVLGELLGRVKLMEGALLKVGPVSSLVTCY